MRSAVESARVLPNARTKVVHFTAAGRSSVRRGHVVYQQDASFLELENKVILIRSFLSTHIPSGHARASLSPGARGVGVKNKNAHTFFRPLPPRVGEQVSHLSHETAARASAGHTATTSPGLGSAPARTHSPNASGARRGSLQNDKQMRSGTHGARLTSAQPPRRCRRPQREAGEMWANLLFLFFLSFELSFFLFFHSFSLPSFLPSSFQGWVVRVCASGST